MKNLKTFAFLFVTCAALSGAILSIGPYLEPKSVPPSLAAREQAFIQKLRYDRPTNLCRFDRKINRPVCFAGLSKDELRKILFLYFVAEEATKL